MAVWSCAPNSGKRKAYRIRFNEYRAALPTLTVDELGFGLLLSRNIIGQNNALVGICLCGVAVSILADLKSLVEDMRGTVTLETWERCLAEIRALPDDYPTRDYMIGKAER